MRKIRSKVFETNSSSSHSLQLVPADHDSIEKPNYHGDECTVPFCEFGWAGSCETWEEKFAYLVELIWETTLAFSKDASIWYPDTQNAFTEALHILRENEDYKRIEELVLKHINASAIEWTGRGYIDHQSYEDYNDLKDWLVSNNVGTTDDDIIQFIFGQSSIDISNDNR